MRVVETKRVDSVEGDDRVVFGVLRGLSAFRRRGKIGEIEERGGFGGRVEAEAGDVDDRALWDDYMRAYEDAINETATAHSPWYVLPADQKWYTRYLVSEAALAALEDCKPLYPLVGPEDIEAMASSRDRLLAE